MSKLYKLAILFSFTVLTGCASITESKNQSMSVNTGEITGAMCTLSNSKGQYFVTSPGSVMVRNACDPLTITCTKKGYVLLTLAQVLLRTNQKVWHGKYYIWWHNWNCS